MRLVIVNICRWLVGLLFILSGVIKLNDPIGTGIKFEEYFHVFATDFGAFFGVFAPYSLLFSVVLSTVEVMVGFAVLLKYRAQLTTWILLLMILFFSFLTFYSAYTGKVTDCGCFGNAIPMTPWESFGKNIVLLGLIVYLFLNRQSLEPVFNLKTGNYVIGGIVLVSLFIAIMAIRHLPFIDFRPYHLGANIRKKMEPSEPLKYEYTFKKNGSVKTFQKYPSDTTWEFQEMNLINPEAQAIITDYNVWNKEGDFTEQTLTGNKLLVIIHDVEEVDQHPIRMVKPLLGNLENSRIQSLVVTASGEKAYQKFRHEYQLAIPYYFADATVLKTIIRSNPGIVLMKDGIIKGKWHYNDVPEISTVENLVAN